MPGIFIGNSIVNQVGSSWSSYWESQDEVLFFAETKDIADGKLYNKKSGSSDYLTVAGEAGSYTFQCPNTADYIAADESDTLWFNFLTGLNRTVTTAELIGFDISRTPVRYGDSSPYSLEGIMILKSGTSFSEEDRNRLFKEFRLSVLWDNSFNPYGYLKGNKGLTQVLWRVLGDEMVSNKTFETNAGWTESAKFTIHDGRAYYFNDTTGSYTLTLTGVLFEVGASYLLEFDQYDRGIDAVYLYDVEAVYYPDGHNKVVRVAKQTRIRFRGVNAGSASFDNISIKKILTP